MVCNNSGAAMKFGFLYSPCLFISLTCALLQSLQHLPTGELSRLIERFGFLFIWLGRLQDSLSLSLSSSLPLLLAFASTFSHTALSASSSYAHRGSEWDEETQKYTVTGFFMATYPAADLVLLCLRARSGELCLSFIEEIKTTYNYRPACLGVWDEDTMS